MAREFARKFYKSRAWKDTRDSYIRIHPLCEPCLKAGMVSIGEIVHHKTHVTPETIDDQSVTLSFDNLETVCRKCHALEHPEIYGRQYQAERPGYAFDEDGNIIRTSIGGLDGD